MKREKLIKIGAVTVGMIALVLVFWLQAGGRSARFNSGLMAAQPDLKILFLEETPSPVLVAAKKAFPGYKVARQEERHLAHFLEGDEIVLAYDVQALPLIRAGAEAYFYPLYNDAVILAVNQEKLAGPVRGWQDILTEQAAVSLPDRSPEQSYIWQAIAYGLTGSFQRTAAQEYLGELYGQNRLFWDNVIAPVQITLYSDYLYTLRRKDITILWPQEGTLAFQVGLLAHHPLEAGQVAAIRQVYQDLNYLSPKKNWQPENDSVLFAASRLPEFYDFGEIDVPLERHVKQNHQHAPINGWEHQIVAVGLIILTILWIGRVNRTVIHLGVRRGLALSGLLIIGWISVGILKYSIYGGADYIRALWYSYYLFLLMLPPVGIFIALNLDQYDESVFPLRLAAVCAVSGLLLLLVLTNDLHQQFFRFLTSDKNLWYKRYKHNWGYYLTALWIILTQTGMWLYLVRKSWDAPKRKMAVLPILVLILGVAYSVCYNLKVPFFREISLALGMGSIILLFWTAILKSDLIPSNRGYHELFEHSLLDMRILDQNGRIRFQSAGVEIPADSEDCILPVETDWPDAQKPFFAADKDRLLWSTAIRGGRIVTRENIRELSSLKQNLERVTRELEEENLILSKKEQVESCLIFMRAQNELTEEVNQLVEDKINKMNFLLQAMKTHPQLREKGLIQLQRLAIYCKRRCELLIKSKQQGLCSAADLIRLIDEINLGTFSECQFFYGLKSGISYPEAAEVYERCHLFYEWALAENISTMTIRLFQEKGELVLYFLIESDQSQQRKSLQEKLNTASGVSYKELGDAFSVLVPIREEML